jgi:hypothetical protein
MIMMGKGILEIIHGTDAALFASRSLAKRAACPVSFTPGFVDQKNRLRLFGKRLNKRLPCLPKDQSVGGCIYERRMSYCTWGQISDIPYNGI